jgi:hypothetical protein
MMTYIRILLISTVIAAQALTLNAQTLSVTLKSTASYPQLSADFFLLDKDGLPLNPVSKDDLRITEGGTQRTIVSLTCPPTNTPLPVSVVLTFDASLSMEFYGGSRFGTGDNNLTIAQKAGKAFVQAFQMPPSECAITSFNSRAYLNTDYSTDKARLSQTIDALVLDNQTRYTPAFLDARSGAIPIAVRGQHNQKAIIFLTDGINFDFFDPQNVINAANNAGIKIFCIGLRLPLSTELRFITEQTGGEGFSNVTTTAQAEAIYRRIVQKIQGYAPCELIWETSGCEQQKTAIIEHIPTGLKDTVRYTINPSQLAQWNISPLGTHFGIINNPATKDTTVYLKAQNNAITLEKLTINNPFSIISPTVFPITIPANDSIPIIIRFIPTDTKYAYAELIPEGTGCNQAIGYFSGGSAAQPPTPPTLQVIHPNGFEKFLWKTDTVIRWRGVLPQDTVTLEYSIDNGTTWTLISDKATGLEHPWTVPATPSKQCIMRVTQQVRNEYIPYASIRLTSGIKDILFSPDNTKLYILTEDSVVRQHNTNNGSNNYAINNANALFIGLNGDGSHLAYTTSPDNNIKLYSNMGIYIANLGLQSTNAQRPVFIGRDTIIFGANGSLSGIVNFTTGSTGFIRTINEPGIIEWNDVAETKARYLAVNPSQKVVTIYNMRRNNVFADSIRIMQQNTPVRGAIAKDASSVLVTDNIGNAYFTSLTNRQTIILSQKNMFSTGYDPQGTFMITGGLQQQRIVNGQSQNYAEAVLYSPTGGIIGILDTHTHTISSVIVSKDGTIATGGKDSIVYLWKIQMPQSDISDNLWEIVAPQLTVNSIFMDSVIINIGSRDSLVENAITNTGEVAVRISSVTITGTNNQEFSRTIISPSLLLQPNESLALECNFSPTAIGKREAIITVETQDNYTAQGIISGEGISLLLENHPPIDFGKRFLGDTKDTIITAVIRNIGTIAVNFAAPRFLALNPNNIPFSFIQSPEKFTLKNQDSIEVKIRFSPTKLGQFTALLEYGFDKTGSPIRIPVFGEGICSNGADSLIVTSNAQSVAPGDTLTVALRLHYPPNAIQSATRPYRMTIDYDTTVLRRITPDADQFDTRLQSSDTVQYMRFLVMLGKSDTASVRVSSFDWGEYCTNAPAIIQGTVPVEICYAGGKRLFNPDGKLITGISPNPPNERSIIHFSTNETGITHITITSLIGEHVATILQEYIHAGEYSLPLPLDTLTTGIYFMTITTPTQQQSLLFSVQ